MPDVFKIRSRMIDTAGIGFIIFGLLIYSGFTIVSIKLLILGFVLIFIALFLVMLLLFLQKTGLEPN